MPDPVETQNVAVAAPMARRDMAGRVIGQASDDAACSHVGSRTHAAGTPLCAPAPIGDPTSFGAPVAAVVCAVLIVGGVLTFMGRGPGRLIRPRPRRRGATQRARRWRRSIGVVLVVVGVIGLVRSFG